ncbi:TPA: hypothetical protein HA219_00610 [Candidatus Woesearchaeota archaeon]|nr:hypothetical protein [Candidatus Woesearchaeota archaeon]HIH39215.1 hypothetical protein [Candidatus Woesearchaeota archaeon]
MAESAFRGAIDFFQRLGIYDVVLPFLLVFTIVFAVLERTKVFGTEKIDGKEYTRKNLNSVAAFVIALLTVASSQIVAVINQGLAKIVLLLVIVISFLMLIGSFFGKDEVQLTGNWRAWGMGVLFVGIVLIFANEVGWLTPFWDYLMVNWNTNIVGAVALIILVVLFMGYVTKGEKPEKKEGGK